MTSRDGKRRATCSSTACRCRPQPAKEKNPSMRHSEFLFAVIAVACLRFGIADVGARVRRRACGERTVAGRRACGAIEGPREHDRLGHGADYNLIGKGFPADMTYSTCGSGFPARNRKKRSTESASTSAGVLVCTGKPGSCPGQGARRSHQHQDHRGAGRAEALRRRLAMMAASPALRKLCRFPSKPPDKKCKLSVVRQSAAGRAGAGARHRIRALRDAERHRPLGGDDTVHSPTARSDGSWQAVIGTKPRARTPASRRIKVADSSAR